MIKKNNLLELDIAAHQVTIFSVIKSLKFIFLFKDRIDAIESQAKEFVEADHFDAPAIKEKQESVSARYQDLQVLVPIYFFV